MQRTDVREQDESKAMRYSPFRMQQSANVCSLQGLPAAMLKSYAVYTSYKSRQWFVWLKSKRSCFFTATATACV